MIEKPVCFCLETEFERPRVDVRRTFIMSTTVFRAIMIMMEYSKGGDTTNFHMRYWKECVFWGM